MSRNDADSRPQRRTALLWAGGALAAAVAVLGVNGTLSGWSSAIIDNNHNTVASTGAVSLVESDGDHVCDTSTSPTNQVTCADINKYGGTGSPLAPGGSRQVTVDLTNNGTVPGDLILDASACQGDPVGSGGLTLCDAVGVDVECANPDAGTWTSGPQALSLFDGGTVASLMPGQSVSCTFTVSLPVDTPATYASHQASQPLRWTLTSDVA